MVCGRRAWDEGREAEEVELCACGTVLILLVRGLSRRFRRFVCRLRHGEEDLVDVRQSLRARLKVAQLMNVGKLLSFFSRHLTIQVRLQTDQEHRHRLAGVLLDLLDPLFDVLEGSTVRNFETEEETFGFLVLRASDERILLLSCSIELRRRWSES